MWGLRVTRHSSPIILHWHKNPLSPKPEGYHPRPFLLPPLIAVNRIAGCNRTEILVRDFEKASRDASVARNPQLANVNIVFRRPPFTVAESEWRAGARAILYERKTANMICNLQRHKLRPIGAARRERAVSSRAHLHSVGREKRSCSRSLASLSQRRRRR